MRASIREIHMHIGNSRLSRTRTPTHVTAAAHVWPRAAIFGSSTVYGPLQQLALSHDIVVVEINYRYAVRSSAGAAGAEESFVFRTWLRSYMHMPVFDAHTCLRLPHLRRPHTSESREAQMLSGRDATTKSHLARSCC